MSAQPVHKTHPHSRHRPQSDPFNQFCFTSPKNSNPSIQYSQYKQKYPQNLPKQRKQYRVGRVATQYANKQANPFHQSLEKNGIRRQSQHRLQDSYGNVRQSIGSSCSKLSVKKIGENLKYTMNETPKTSFLDLKQTIFSQSDTTNKYEEIIRILTQQISQQEKSISKLTTLVKQLTSRISEQQTKILFLSSKGSSNPEQETDRQIIQSNIYNLEEKSYNMYKALQKTQRQQNLINDKIDSILKANIKMFGGKLNLIKKKFLQFTQFVDHFEISKIQVVQKHTQMIRGSIENFKELLNQQEISLKKTARFPDQKMQDSMSNMSQTNSYFFHPSELKHFSKIQQLYDEHQFEPLRCYIDSRNRLKYLDSHSFVYDRKGNIIHLSEKEKRYYMDRGLVNIQ